MSKIDQTINLKLLIGTAAVCFAASATAQTGTADKDMGFFVVSANPGQGANLGGLAGADRYCQQLAGGAGAGGKTWHAYLSTMAGPNGAGVNARDRIGQGPWKNFKGEVIAKDVADLHGSNNNLSKQTALTEKGEVLAGRGDPVNMHDILTGSQMDGSVARVDGGGDVTCGNWTQGGAEGSAFVGHHDRIGLNDSAPMKSWVSSHPSRGCSLEGLKTTGGNGRFYCFATN